MPWWRLRAARCHELTAFAVSDAEFTRAARCADSGQLDLKLEKPTLPQHDKCEQRAGIVVSCVFEGVTVMCMCSDLSERHSDCFHIHPLADPP